MRTKQYETTEAPTQWWDSAACLNENPELFFPVGTAGPGAEERMRAKAVCHGCPVRAECLGWAMHLGCPSGIWGGLDEGEGKR